MSPVSRNSFAKPDPILGFVAPQGIPSGTQAAILSASRAYYARFVPARNSTATKIAFVTTVAATNNDNVDVGIYNAAGEKIVSSGATAGVLNATAGVQTVTITATPLTAGTVYYAAMACGTVGGTAATVVQNALTNTKYPQILGTSVPNIFVGVQESAATLPASATMNANASAVPILAVRES